MPLSNPKFPPVPAEALWLCQAGTVECLLQLIQVLKRRWKHLNNSGEEHTKNGWAKEMAKDQYRKYGINKVTTWKRPLE